MLIGFMATGKTTVGRIVAERLGRPFVDLDRLIEETAGMPVSEIFRSAGESAFRAAEATARQGALDMPQAVIATGGGAACREETIRALLARALVVALSATPAEVLRRTGGHSGRPLLDGSSNPMKTAAALLAEREPFYERAHVRVDTVGKTPQGVATEVLAAVRDEEGVQP